MYKLHAGRRTDTLARRIREQTALTLLLCLSLSVLGSISEGADNTASDTLGRPGPPLGHRDFYPTPAHPVGFRGDWSGRFPGAEPPMQWMLPVNFNTIYTVKVGIGESSPVLVGDRIFILTDACHLRCLDRADGRVLWTREHHALPDKEGERKFWELEEYGLLHHRMQPFRERLGSIDGKLKNAKAGDANHKALTAERSEVEAKVGPLAAAQARIDLAKWGAENRRGVGATKAIVYAMATVCSDGESVYAYLPTGAIVCYDLAGRRRWFRGLGGEKRSAGDRCYPDYVYTSPVLVENRIVVEYDRIYCLDATNGATVWTADLLGGTDNGLGFPTPAAGRVGGTWYVGSGDCQVFRLADGKRIGNHGPLHPPVGSMIFHDGGFNRLGFFIELPSDPGGTTKLRWKISQEDTNQIETGDPQKQSGIWGHHEQGTCVVYDRGRFFFQAEHGAFSALDALTGKALKSINPGRPNPPYSGLAVAGDLVCTTGTDFKFIRTTTNSPPDFVVVGGCEGGPSGGNHWFFHANRAYTHYNDLLVCFGDPLAPDLGAGGRPQPFDDAGPNDVPMLTAKLAAGEAWERRNAAQALLRLGTGGEAIVEAAAKALVGETDGPAAYTMIRFLGTAKGGDGKLAETVKALIGAPSMTKRMQGLVLARALGPRVATLREEIDRACAANHRMVPIRKQIESSMTGKKVE